MLFRVYFAGLAPLGLEQDEGSAIAGRVVAELSLSVVFVTLELPRLLHHHGAEIGLLRDLWAARA